MSFEQQGLLVLGLYLAFMLAIAEWAKRARRDDTPGDHFLAGRELGVFVLFLTLYATAYSGNSLLGYPGRAYRSGFSFIMATGFMMSIIVMFHLLVPKLRPVAVQYGFVTPGDWLRHRFGNSGAARWLRLAVGFLMTLALANFLLAQLKAMGEVTSLVTGGLIPYEVGVVGLAGLILFYETRGGMRAVAWTDAVQGILMLVGLAALGSWLVAGEGGLEAITLAVARERPSAVSLPDAETCANWFSTIALLGIASVIYPQAIQRIYAAKSSQALTRSFSFMTFMPLATTLVVTLIGVAAIAQVDLSSGVESDGVMPALLEQWAASGTLGHFGALLVFVGALSAIMSTADSCLLSLGSLLARDLMGRTQDDGGGTRMGKMLAAAVLIATIPLALYRDITLWRLIELKLELLIQCAPAFLIALHWPGLRAGPAALGVVLGTTVSVGLNYAGMPRVEGIHAGLVGLAVNLAVAVAGSFRPASPRSAHFAGREAPPA